MKISSSTGLIGLIGCPVGHSISPEIHNFFCSEYNVDMVYLSFNVIENELENAVKNMTSLGIKGFNVTIPYKEKVLQYIDFLDETADIIGSVNTISLENGKLIGYNTDCMGFGRSLREKGAIVENNNVIVLGSGGSARAIVYELIKMKAKSVFIFNRNLENAKRLASYMNYKFGREVCLAFELDRLEDMLKISDSNLIVNCTPLGMYPNMDGSPVSKSIELGRDIVLYDLIYNPGRTKFLDIGYKQGCKIINGLGMLIWQAAYSFKYWTGIEVANSVVEKLRIQIK